MAGKSTSGQVTSHVDSRIYIQRTGESAKTDSLDEVVRAYESGRLSGNTRVSLDGKRWVSLFAFISSLPGRSSSPPPRTFRLSSPAHSSVTSPPPPARSSFRLAGAAFQRPEIIVWTLVLVTFPLFLLWLVENAGVTLNQTVWLSSGYYCLIYALLLRYVMGMNKRNWKNGLLYALFTAFIGIPVLLVWYNLPVWEPFANMLEADWWGHRFVGQAVHTGLLEEGCKLLPLIYIGMRRSGIASESEGLWLGIMAGLGFAWAEGVHYTAMYWNSSVLDQLAIFADGMEIGAAEDVVLSDMMARSWVGFMHQQTRFLTLPILHAAFTSVAALLAARAFLTGHWWWMGAGWIAAAMLHGLYNAFAGGLVGILVAVGTIMILVILADRTSQHLNRDDIKPIQG